MGNKLSGAEELQNECYLVVTEEQNQSILLNRPIKQALNL
jgi:hypothetical protein